MRRISMAALVLSLSPHPLLISGDGWKKVINLGDESWGNAAVEVPDGYVIAGTEQTFFFGQYKMLLVKTDPGGVVTWSKSFGPIDEVDYEAFSVLSTSDGGFLMAGATYHSTSPDREIYLVKTDSDGDLDWDRLFPVNSVQLCSMVHASDGGYMIAGSIRSNSNDLDTYLLKVDENGDPLWHKAYGDGKDQVGICIQMTSDGGYIVTGTSSSTAYPYLLKVDLEGNQLWEKSYPSANYTTIRSVRQTPEGGFIVVGGENNTSSFLLIRTDSRGELIWTYKFSMNGNDDARAVAITSDCALVVAGTDIQGGVVFKADWDHRIIWKLGPGGPSGSWNSIQEISDGGYLLVGSIGVQLPDHQRTSLWLSRVKPDPANLMNLPGDCNQDGAVDLSDGLCLLWNLYFDDASTLPCGADSLSQAGAVSLLDSNGDLKVDLSDLVYFLSYLFLDSPPPVLGTELVSIPDCPSVCPIR